MNRFAEYGRTAVGCALGTILGVALGAGSAFAEGAGGEGAGGEGAGGEGAGGEGVEPSDTASMTSSGDHWEVSARASTLGAGIELKRTFGDSFAARAVLNGFSYSLDEETSDVDYKGDLNLRSGGLILDFHPGGYWFRVSAGLLLNGNELDVDAEPSGGTFEFNDVVYTTAQVGSASGKAEFDSIAPYVGIGFSSAPGGDSGLSFSADVGVLFQGAPSFDLDVRCGTAVLDATCNQLKSDAEAERKAFEDDTDQYEYYPVVSLAIGYRW